MKINEPWDIVENLDFVASRSYIRHIKDIAFGMAGRDIKTKFLSGGNELGYTDGETICINLYPYILQGRSLKDLMCAHIALIVHEHSHQLYSSWDILRKATRSNLLRDVNNILEDGRIERISAFKLPGWAASLYRLNKIVYDIQSANQNTQDDFSLLFNTLWNYAKVGITPDNLPAHLIGDWKAIRAEILKARYSDTAEPCFDAAKTITNILTKYMQSQDVPQKTEVIKEYSSRKCQGKDAQTGETPPQSGSGGSQSGSSSQQGNSASGQQNSSQSGSGGSQSGSSSQQGNSASGQQNSSQSDSDGSQNGSGSQQGNSTSGQQNGSQSDSDGSQNGSGSQQGNSAGGQQNGSQSGSGGSQSGSNGQQGNSTDEKENGYQSDSDASQGDANGQQENSANGEQNTSQENTEAKQEKSEDENELEKMTEKLNEFLNNLDSELSQTAEDFDRERETEENDRRIMNEVFRNSYVHITPNMEENYNTIKAEQSGVIHNMKSKLFKTIHFNMDEVSRKLTRGKVDGKSLTNILNGAVCSKRKDKSDETNLNVTLVLDASSSMKGTRERMTLRAAIVLMEALELLKIPTSIVAFDDNIYYLKDWRQSKLRKMGVMEYQSDGSTDLTQALRFVREKLIPTQRRYDKIVFVLTDGYPNNENTSRLEAEMLSRIPRTAVYGVGIECNCETGESKFFAAIFGERFYIPCPNLEELPLYLTRVVKRNLLRE